MFKKARNRTIAVVLAVMLTFGGMFAVSAVAAPQPASAAGLTMEQFAAEVHRLTNAERARHGLPPLAFNNTLGEIAQIRAREIVTYFSHTRPNGTSWATLLTEFNIQAQLSTWGENLLWHSPPNTPAFALNQWMTSPGHRANVLRNTFTHMGVGVYVSGGRLHAAQIFVGSNTLPTHQLPGTGPAPTTTTTRPPTTTTRPPTTTTRPPTTTTTTTTRPPTTTTRPPTTTTTTTTRPPTTTTRPPTTTTRPTTTTAVTTTTRPPTTTANTIFSTRWESTFVNWVLFFLGFGFIWMWF